MYVYRNLEVLGFDFSLEDGSENDLCVTLVFKDVECRQGLVSAADAETSAATP